MNNWKVYDAGDKPVLLGDYLTVKYFAGIMCIVYVDTDGTARSQHSTRVKLVREQTGPIHVESGHAPRRKS